MRVAAAVSFAALVLAVLPSSLGEAAPAVTLVSRNTYMPVNVVEAPDGHLYYIELWNATDKTRASVYGIDPATGARDGPFATVDHLVTGYERGLFGLALDPDFAASRAFYVSYTYNKTTSYVTRLSRFVDQKETVLLDDLPAAEMHNGGRILFANDGTMYMSLGDHNPIWRARTESRAQDPKALDGKILHMTRDAKSVPGNLAPGSLIFDLGHRNIYGLAMDAQGRLFATENGNNLEDEIDIIQAGANYGWPACEGPCDPPDARFTEPILHYHPTIGPTGATVFRGDLWFGDFNHGALHHVTQDANGTWHDETPFHATDVPGRVLDLAASRDARTLYFTTWQGIWKVTFPGEANDTAFTARIHPLSPPPPPTPSQAPPATPTLSSPVANVSSPPTPSTPSPTKTIEFSPTQQASPPTKTPAPGPAVALVALALTAYFCARRGKP